MLGFVQNLHQNNEFTVSELLSGVLQRSVESLYSLCYQSVYIDFHIDRQAEEERMGNEIR